jgi:hypothetical protein
MKLQTHKDKIKRAPQYTMTELANRLQIPMATLHAAIHNDTTFPKPAATYPGTKTAPRRTYYVLKEVAAWWTNKTGKVQP